jgi:hypothetical protein
MYSSKRTVGLKFWLVGLVVPMVLFLSLFFIVKIFFTEEYLIMNYLRYGMDIDVPLIRNIIEYSPYPALFLSVFICLLLHLQYKYFIGIKYMISYTCLILGCHI